MVNQFLRFDFSQFTFFHITFDINVEEGRNTAEGHCSTVLRFNRSQVAEVSPLYCFFGVSCWSRNITTIFGCHFFDLTQSAMLFSNFFAQLNGHFQVFTVFQVILQRVELSQFVFHQEVDTVNGYTTIVTDDTATAISIWQTSQYTRFTAVQDVFGINVKHTLVMCFTVFGEDFFQLWVKFTTVNFARTFYHFDAAEWD